jgi:hypothetical protein
MFRVQIKFYSCVRINCYQDKRQSCFRTAQNWIRIRVGPDPYETDANPKHWSEVLKNVGYRYLTTMSGDGEKMATHCAAGEIDDLAVVVVYPPASQQGAHKIVPLQHVHW